MKQENLETRTREIDKFLDSFNLPWLNTDDLEYVKRPITIRKL